MSISLDDKLSKLKPKHAVTGLHFYDNHIVDIAKNLESSDRGELEFRDINSMYLENGQLHIEFFGRGVAWLDTCTHNSLLEALTFAGGHGERSEGRCLG